MVQLKKAPIDLQQIESGKNYIIFTERTGISPEDGRLMQALDALSLKYKVEAVPALEGGYCWVIQGDYLVNQLVVIIAIIKSIVTLDRLWIRLS